MEQYLKSTETIDWQAPEVLLQARKVTAEQSDPVEITPACFEWVGTTLL